jgi:hypothetical protein
VLGVRAHGRGVGAAMGHPDFRRKRCCGHRRPDPSRGCSRRWARGRCWTSTSRDVPESVWACPVVLASHRRHAPGRGLSLNPLKTDRHHGLHPWTATRTACGPNSRKVWLCQGSPWPERPRNIDAAKRGYLADQGHRPNRLGGSRLRPRTTAPADLRGPHKSFELRDAATQERIMRSPRCFNCKPP